MEEGRELQALHEVLIHIYISVILFFFGCCCLETVDGVLACLLSVEVGCGTERYPVHPLSMFDKEVGSVDPKADSLVAAE